MIEYADDRHQQGSTYWKKQRLGNITGSKCADILVKGRGKEEVFGKTAKAYLYQLAGERDIAPEILADEGYLEEYFEEVEVNSKAIRLGHEREGLARTLFMTTKKLHVEDVLSCKHDSIDHFAASPDGMVYRELKDVSDLKPFACLEIKCPGQQNFMLYKSEIHDAESLKAVQPTYYWQTQAEMECTDVNKCFFVVYNFWQKHPIHIVEIDKNEEDCALLRERVMAANEFIDNLLNNGRQSQ